MDRVRDIFDDFPDLDTGDASGFCTTDPEEIRRSGGRDFLRWEKDVARPAIEAAGYRDVSFYTIERDSFGPLVRGVAATHAGGSRVGWFYG